MSQGHLIEEGPGPLLSGKEGVRGQHGSGKGVCPGQTPLCSLSKGPAQGGPSLHGKGNRVPERGQALSKLVQ